MLLRRLLLVVGICMIGAIPTILYAYEFVTPQRNNSETHIDTTHDGRWYFGVLEEFPHPYVFTVREEQSVQFSIMIPKSDSPIKNIGAILVRQSERGVDEVVRLTPPEEASWQTYRDNRTNDSYLVGATYASNLVPGTYILEVHSPVNIGPYVLAEGAGSDMSEYSYFEKVARIKAVKQFHGKSPVTVIASPYVYIPPLVIALGLGFFVGVRIYRRRYA